MVECPKGCGDYDNLHTHWRLSHFEPFPEDIPKTSQAYRDQIDESNTVHLTSDASDYPIGDLYRGVTGEDHPAWKGKDRDSRYSSKFNRLKPEIRKRDGYKCQFCGIEQKVIPETLHVHHVTDEDRRGSLLSLCFWCHLSWHGLW